MSLQIKIRAISQAIKLFYAERVLILNINSALSIMSSLAVRYFMKIQMLFIHSKHQEPKLYFAKPVVKPLSPFIFFHKVFKFYQIKFSGAEDEISWSDFVSENFALGSNAKRQSLPRCHEHVFKINKHSLSDFAAQINS